MKPRVEIDIARNLKAIEWLKTEMLGGLAELFRAMRSAREETVVDQLAHMVVLSHVLAKRLGVDYARLDEAVRRKVELNVLDGHELEEWYGDFSKLQGHLEAAAGQRNGGSV